MSKIPAIFDEYFKSSLTKLCSNVKVKSKQIVDKIPNLNNRQQLLEQIQQLDLVFDTCKKELKSNMQLLFDMTHVIEIPKPKSRKKKKRNKNRLKH
jgi:hypothetical protein